LPPAALSSAVAAAIVPELTMVPGTEAAWMKSLSSPPVVSKTSEPAAMPTVPLAAATAPEFSTWRAIRKTSPPSALIEPRF